MSRIWLVACLPLDKFAIVLQNICMWIERNYSKLLNRNLAQFPVILLTGARQVGKTSLLEKEFPGFSFCSLEDPILAREAEEAPDVFFSKYRLPVIIDEVQYAPKLFRYIKLLLDKYKKKGQFALTGSQSFQLMQNVSESLAGRCGIITMSGISGLERKNNALSFASAEVLLRGSYPELIASKDFNKTDWYRSYIASYLERDVRNILKVGDIRDFSTFLTAVVLRSGQILSYSDLARDVGIAVNTAKSWLSVLEASQVIYLLKPYHKNLGKRLFKSPKLYIRDTGLFCHLANIQDAKTLTSSPYLGAVWETYVLNQIISSNQENGSNPNIWFWRTQNGQEVDFLIDTGGKLTAIEVKYSEKPDIEKTTKGYNSLKQFYGDKIIDKLIIATTGKENHKVGKDIYIKSGWFWE